MTTENTVYELSGTITEHSVKKTKNTHKPYVMLRILTEEGSTKTLRAFQDKVVSDCMEYSEGNDITVKCKDVDKEGDEGQYTMTNIMLVVKTSGANPAVNPTLKPTNQGTGNPQPVQQASVGGTGQIDPNQMRIMRQSTLNYACLLIQPMVKDFASPELMMVRTIQTAGKLLEYVISGEMPSFEDDEEQTDAGSQESGPESEPVQELFPDTEDDESDLLGTIS